MKTIYRYAKTNRLYYLYWVTPMKFTGSWYEAEDIHNGKVIRRVRLADFERIAVRL